MMKMPEPTTPLRSRARQLREGRRATMNDLGQTALVAVIAVSVIVALIGATLVATVVQSFPLQQAAAVSVYAHRALQAGENAYVTAVNANPTLAQCNTGTNRTGACSGLNYGEWNLVSGSSTTDGAAEYYAFGNPQPTFDPTTHALTNLSVQVVGAAHAPHTTTNYVFQSETINLAANNGFLTNVWWSNYESYSGQRQLLELQLQLEDQLQHQRRAERAAAPSTSVPTTTCSGRCTPTTRCSSAETARRPAVRRSVTSPPTPDVPSAVNTADPHCLFVDTSNGMSGGYSTCNSANSDVALYDHANSSYGNPVQAPPQSDAQLGIIAVAERLPLLRSDADHPEHRCQRASAR